MGLLIQRRQLNRLNMQTKYSMIWYLVYLFHSGHFVFSVFYTSHLNGHLDNTCISFIVIDIAVSCKTRKADATAIAVMLRSHISNVNNRCVPLFYTYIQSTYTMMPLFIFLISPPLSFFWKKDEGILPPLSI